MGAEAGRIYDITLRRHIYFEYLEEGMRGDGHNGSSLVILTIAKILTCIVHFTMTALQRAPNGKSLESKHIRL
jgi:hypothetical protein